MKTLGAVLVLIFFCFAWGSHIGIIPGNSDTHGLVGAALLIIAILGMAIFYAKAHNSPHEIQMSIFRTLTSLWIFNAVVFLVCSAIGCIGPEAGDNKGLVGIVYFVMAIFATWILFQDMD